MGAKARTEKHGHGKLLLEPMEMINTVWQQAEEYQRYGMADTGLAPLSFM
jgi:hypothetical protein